MYMFNRIHSNNYYLIQVIYFLLCSAVEPMTTLQTGLLSSRLWAYTVLALCSDWSIIKQDRWWSKFSLSQVFLVPSLPYPKSPPPPLYHWDSILLKITNIKQTIINILMVRAWNLASLA